MMEAGEPEENIAAVIQRMSGRESSSASSQLETPEPSTISRVGTGTYNALKGLASTAYKGTGAKALVEGRGPLGIVGDQLQTAYDLTIGPQVEEYRAAKAAEEEGRTSEMVGHSVAAAIPILGPLAGHVGEMVGEGKTPELAGEGIIAALIPAGVRGAAKGAAATNAAIRSAAESELLARIAKRSARPLGAAVGGAAGGFVAGAPGATAGAVIGSEVGQMLHGALRRRGGSAVDTPVAIVEEATPTPRPSAGALPPAPIEMGPSPDGSYVRSVPAEYPEVKFPEPVAVAPKTATPKKTTPRPRDVEPPVKASAKGEKSNAAAALQEKMRTKELARVRKELGTKDVQIVRYEPRSDAKGNKTGIADPVYVVPDEFVEQAQIMGLRVRRQTALEKAARVRRAEGKQ